ncbi:hypothetical protein D3C87_1627040 [compost metagenome]
MRRQQSLATWLYITATCPDGAIFEFTGGFIQADAAFVAGVVFIVGTVFGRERDFIRVAAGAGLSQLDGGKGADVQAEHVPGIARGKIQAQVGRRMRQVGGVFIVIVTGRIEIFTVTLTLPVIYAAGHRGIIDKSCGFRLRGHGKPCSQQRTRDCERQRFTLSTVRTHNEIPL